jgi:ribulose-phosphate 3-epimerase
MPITISASILSADFSNLENQLRQCERAKVDWIHIDVMDGHFVPNLTMGPFIVETCNRITNLPLDCHLMVENPDRLIDAFINAGADYISIHPEDNPKVIETLQYMKSRNIQAGLAINPGTSLESVKSFFNEIDMILIMTVHPGYSGQEFMVEVIEKISEAKRIMADFPNIKYLEVDGGINRSTIAKVVNAGANCCVAATAIFKDPSGILNAVDGLRSAVN